MPKTRVRQKADTWVIDNATTNMMNANPGMSRAVARKRAIDKLWRAVKVAMWIG